MHPPRSLTVEAHSNLDDNTFINDDNSDSSTSYGAGHEGSTGEENISSDDFSTSTDDETT